MTDAIVTEWRVVICDENGRNTGPEITCDGWNVHSIIAAYRMVLPYGWEIKGYLSESATK